MARIRSIHPGLWTDEAFVSVSPLARLLCMGLWNEADDQGIFEWKPLTLKIRLLPTDAVNVADLLNELSDVNIVCQFVIGGRSYGAIRNFGRFQRPKSPNSTYPITPEIRKYVALDAQKRGTRGESDSGGSEVYAADPTTFPPNGEIEAVKQTPFPPNGEKSPQMEEGVRRRERKKAINLPSVAEAACSVPPGAAAPPAPPQWPPPPLATSAGAVVGGVVADLTGRRRGSGAAIPASAIRTPAQQIVALNGGIPRPEPQLPARTVEEQLAALRGSS